jgi:serine/threonine protein phosphatase PrpC
MVYFLDRTKNLENDKRYNCYYKINEIIENEMDKIFKLSKENSKKNIFERKYIKIIESFIDNSLNILFQADSDINKKDSKYSIITHPEKFLFYELLTDYGLISLDKKSELYKKLIKYALFNLIIHKSPVSVRILWLKQLYNLIWEEYKSYENYEWIIFKSDEEYIKYWNKLKYEVDGKLYIPYPCERIRRIKFVFDECINNNLKYNINLEELLKTRQTNRTNNNNTKDFLNNTQNLNNSQNNSNSLFFEQYNSLNNLLTNQINNLYSFQTNIISNNNNIPNFQLNNDLNQLTYNQTNYETNIGLNHLHLNYIENSQDDYLNSSSYEQFLNNKIQREDNKNFKESALLRDFGVLSRPGNDESGLPKINQDAYIIKTKINKINDFNIFGVLDGHGPLGNLISEFVSEFIPNQIINDPEIKYESNEESIYNNLKSYDFQIIKQAFICADNGLKNLNYDISDSGTTCVLIIHIGNHLICANVGDSRAVVAFDEEDDPNLNFLRIIPLSIDFKPELPDEKSRILTYGGVVEQAKNNFGQKIGPYRVYASGKDFPGLAMSRSIGDSIAKKIGVISEPGITEYFIGKNTKFFILCSDGVWEFLSNDNVRDIGKQFYLNSNAKELCQELISRSLIEWKTNDLIIDDITAIAAFFSK